MAGPRHPYVEEPPLLCDRIRRPPLVARRVDAAQVRQDLLLEAHQEDVGELEPLGAVERHQGDAVVFLVPGVLA